MSKKILVVDDELHIRMLYQEELAYKGFKVATSDGTEPILHLLDREKPDLVILDIKLGLDKSGLDLLQEIRSRDQDLPVILCTGFETFQNDLKSVDADHYIIKSADMDELMDKVMKIMTTQRGHENP